MSDVNPLVRGVPVQDLPENQDPTVRYTVIEQTGEVVPWDLPETGVLEDEGPAKKRGRKPAKAVDEGAGHPGAEVAATSVRELGS